MPTIKLLHVIFVIASVSGFFVRGLLMRDRPDWLRNRWVRTVPHVNDTLLLTTGIVMVVSYGWNPLQQPWLTAKLLALLLYIGLGTVAIGRWGRRGTGVRTAAWLAAIGVFTYIVFVALTKTPQPWLVL